MNNDEVYVILACCEFSGRHYSRVQILENRGMYSLVKGVGCANADAFLEYTDHLMLESKAKEVCLI